MFKLSQKSKFIFVVVFLALITFSLGNFNLAKADEEALIPKCSEPEFDDGQYYVLCKPGDGATIRYAGIRKILGDPAATISYSFVAGGALITFTDPASDACFFWRVRDTNGNFNDYTRGYPNYLPPFCDN